MLTHTIMNEHQTYVHTYTCILTHKHAHPQYAHIKKMPDQFISISCQQNDVHQADHCKTGEFIKGSSRSLVYNLEISRHTDLTAML